MDLSHDADAAGSADAPNDPVGDADTPPLDPVEARVLGCLLEKERTTPADYPLTLNGLTRACNQSTSREPVMALSESEVAAALERLKAAALVRFVHSPSNRATKFRHVAREAWSLGDAELAVLCLLLLRGPQTTGELRTRAERLHPFESLGAVEEVLSGLSIRTPPMVRALPRAAGQKEVRWAELLRGSDGSAAGAPASVPATAGVAADSPVGGAVREDRLALLEQRVAGLEVELARLRSVLEAALGPLEDPA